MYSMAKKKKKKKKQIKYFHVTPENIKLLEKSSKVPNISLDDFLDLTPKVKETKAKLSKQELFSC